jgi:hypothetical protein
MITLFIFPKKTVLPKAKRSTGRAVTYDNSSFADRINEFRKNYDSLPELLKKQRLNENDIRWFLQSIHWQKN